MASYIISEQSLNDLNNIWLFTARKWSIDQADRYYNFILDEIEYLSENFMLAKDFGNIRKGYRYAKVKSHLIFCRKINDSSIEVVRILHEKMDVENRIDG